MWLMSKNGKCLLMTSKLEGNDNSALPQFTNDDEKMSKRK